jgi:hypothetical protein
MKISPTSVRPCCVSVRMSYLQSAHHEADTSRRRHRRHDRHFVADTTTDDAVADVMNTGANTDEAPLSRACWVLSCCWNTTHWVWPLPYTAGFTTTDMTTAISTVASTPKCGTLAFPCWSQRTIFSIRSINGH